MRIQLFVKDANIDKRFILSKVYTSNIRFEYFHFSYVYFLGDENVDCWC